MAKQSINLGSTANDGTGDPLRTAFDKINDNFDELYTYSTATAGNNITITANTIASDDTNGNIILDPNGTGRVVVATSNELRFNTHTDNAILYVDADGDVQFSSDMTYDGTTVTLEDITFANGTLGTANSNQDLNIQPSGIGLVNFGTTTQTTVGSAGSATAVPAQPTGYLQIKVSGTTRVIPFYDAS